MCTIYLYIYKYVYKKIVDFFVHYAKKIYILE